jgi:hypothetical protein
MMGMPEIELPPLEERVLRAKWFASLSDEERDDMIHRPFAWIEDVYSEWRATQEPRAAA